MTKLFMRMENDSSAAAAADPQESLAIDANARVDAEAVTEAAADVTSVDTGIENALEAESEVAGATATMEEAVAEGDGLSPREAEMVEARLERAARLVGADLGAMGLTFRRESFGGRESRLAVTKMRLEAAEGFGARIWESIKKAWQWLVDMAKNLFGKLTKSADSQIERFKTLEQRLGSLKGKQKETKMKAAVGTFSIAGKAGLDTMKEMADQTEKYRTLYANIFEKLSASALPKLDSGKLAETVSQFNSQLHAVISGAFGADQTVTAKGFATTDSAFGRLPGGRSIVIKQKGSGKAEQEIVTAGFSVEKIDEKLAEDYNALSAEEIRSLCTRGAAVAKGLKDFKKDEDAMTKLINANVTWLDTQAKVGTKTAEAGKDNDSERDYAGAIRAIVTSNQALVKVATTALPTAYFQIVSGLGDVVAAGIGNFKAEEK